MLKNSCHGKKTFSIYPKSDSWSYFRKCFGRQLSSIHSPWIIVFERNYFICACLHIYWQLSPIYFISSVPKEFRFLFLRIFFLLVMIIDVFLGLRIANNIWFFPSEEKSFLNSRSSTMNMWAHATSSPKQFRLPNSI